MWNPKYYKGIRDDWHCPGQGLQNISICFYNSAVSFPEKSGTACSGLESQLWIGFLQEFLFTDCSTVTTTLSEGSEQHSGNAEHNVNLPQTELQFCFWVFLSDPPIRMDPEFWWKYIWLRNTMHICFSIRIHLPMDGTLWKRIRYFYCRLLEVHSLIEKIISACLKLIPVCFLVLC